MMTLALLAGSPLRRVRRATPSAPSWLASAAVHEMVAVPNSTPNLAAGLAPSVAGSMGSQAKITDAWGGAFVHDGRFYIHGGGHADYGGNEIGVLNLLLGSPQWALAIERTPVAQLLGGANYYADGRPTSRHTYNGMWAAVIGGVPKMLRFNAWMGFAFNGSPVGGNADVRTLDIDAFNLNAGEWEPAAYGPNSVILGSETSMAQDPTTGDCWAWSTGNDIYKYTLATDSCALAANLTGTEGGGGALIVDAVNQRVVKFAGRASSKIVYWSIGGGATKVLPTAIGPDAADFNGLTGDNHGWGVAHDTLTNAAYVMTNAGVLYRIRLADFHVTKIMPTGVAPASATNAVWGKFKYIAALHAVVYLSKWTEPVLAMKCQSSD
jgi:hypothetical protein